jgi:5-methyltetrahydropteroyltriglutamate--homocysteine methyltransferase
MLRSTERILTTHVGSLPRAAELGRMLAAQEWGEKIDDAKLARLKEEGVRATVRHQRDAKVDIGNDGEQTRVSYVTYVPVRMKGFGGESRRPAARDLVEFPEVAERARLVHSALTDIKPRTFVAPQAVGPVRYDDLAGVAEECAMFKRALAEAGQPFRECFMTAASPGVIAFVMENAYYDSHEAYVFALAREMRKEYEYIAEQGFVLQLDCPDLANEYAKRFWDKPISEYCKVIETHVAALNEAIAGIPPDRVRLHLCYGNYEAPHTHDPALADILAIAYQARVGAFSVELSNPRHQHEIKVLRDRPPPGDAVLIPGVIDTLTSFVEHPELVADRLCAAVAAVGDRERVIAGADCGFSTFAGNERVPPSVVWAKLATMAEGARIASERLWGKTSG